MNEALWALGRGTGVVALLLLTASIVLGILTRSGRPMLKLPRFGVALVHRNAALLATIFVAIHVITLFFDTDAQLKVVDFVVPFVGSYRPFWLGLGTLAVDLLIAIVATALLRKRLGARVFKGIHLATYGLWPIALFHTIGTGTDAATPWLIGAMVVCCAAVVGAVGWRASARYSESRGARLEGALR